MTSIPARSESLPIDRVLGVPIHLHHDYAGWLSDRVCHSLGTHVVTLNAEMSMLASQERQLGETIDRAELTIPDGAGVVLYLKLKGHEIRRAPGIEVAETLLSGLAGTGKTAFFFGGAPGVTDKAATKLMERYAGLDIIGTQHGYLKPEEMPRFEARLQELQPSVILVGLGVPRQEYWIAEHREICPNAVWVGVGGSFDVWAGVKTRAPKWMGDNHLEWLYRLYCEPWRWKRMLALPKFAVVALLDLAGLGRSRR